MKSVGSRPARGVRGRASGQILLDALIALTVLTVCGGAFFASYRVQMKRSVLNHERVLRYLETENRLASTARPDSLGQ